MSYASRKVIFPGALLYTFVGDAFDFDMTWEPTMEANALVVSSVVSSLLGVFPHPASIGSIAVNFAISALTVVAVPGSTDSTASTVSSTPMVWWENGSHKYKAMHLSGYVTGLGLSRLCITPSIRLKNHCWTASDDHEADTPHQSSSHLFPSSLFCFLVLANQLSRCGYSLPTLLETKPPFL